MIQCPIRRNFPIIYIYPLSVHLLYNIYYTDLKLFTLFYFHLIPIFCSSNSNSDAGMSDELYSQLARLRKIVINSMASIVKRTNGKTVKIRLVNNFIQAAHWRNIDI